MIDMTWETFRSASKASRSIMPRCHSKGAQGRNAGSHDVRPLAQHHADLVQVSIVGQHYF